MLSFCLFLLLEKATLTNSSLYTNETLVINFWKYIYTMMEKWILFWHNYILNLMHIYTKKQYDFKDKTNICNMLSSKKLLIPGLVELKASGTTIELWMIMNWSCGNCHQICNSLDIVTTVPLLLLSLFLLFLSFFLGSNKTSKLISNSSLQ
jgi:hypothetical protein